MGAHIFIGLPLITCRSLLRLMWAQIFYWFALNHLQILAEIGELKRTCEEELAAAANALNADAQADAEVCVCFVRVCLSIDVCARLCVYVCTCARACVCGCVCVSFCACVHACACMLVYICVCDFVSACMRACLCVCVSVCVYVGIIINGLKHVDFVGKTGCCCCK
jgi:hypothetical protein